MHRDCGKRTLRDVGHGDTDQGDDSVRPVVAKDKSDHEEAYTEGGSDGSDDGDEMLNLLGDGVLTSFQSRGQSGNPPHDCDVDDHTHAGSLHGVGGEGGQALSLQWVLVSELWSP